MRLDVARIRLLLLLDAPLEVGPRRVLVRALHLVDPLAQTRILRVAIVLLLVEHRLPLRVQLRLLRPQTLLLLLAPRLGRNVGQHRRLVVLLIRSLLDLLPFRVGLELLAQEGVHLLILELLQPLRRRCTRSLFAHLRGARRLLDLYFR